VLPASIQRGSWQKKRLKTKKRVALRSRKKKGKNGTQKRNTGERRGGEEKDVKRRDPPSPSHRTSRPGVSHSVTSGGELWGGNRGESWGPFASVKE